MTIDFLRYRNYTEEISKSELQNQQLYSIRPKLLNGPKLNFLSFRGYLIKDENEKNQEKE